MDQSHPSSGTIAGMEGFEKNSGDSVADREHHLVPRFKHVSNLDSFDSKIVGANFLDFLSVRKSKKLKSLQSILFLQFRIFSISP